MKKGTAIGLALVSASVLAAVLWPEPLDRRRGSNLHAIASSADSSARDRGEGDAFGSRPGPDSRVARAGGASHESVRTVRPQRDTRPAPAALDDTEIAALLRSGEPDDLELARRVLREASHKANASDLVSHVLLEGETDQRIALIALLGELGEPAAIGPLERLLEESSGAEQLQIAWSLCELGECDALEPIVERVRGDLESLSAVERSAAVARARVLGRADLVTSALDDPSGAVRLNAAVACRELCGSEARPALERLLDDPSHVIASAAARTLWSLDQPGEPPPAPSPPGGSAP